MPPTRAWKVEGGVAVGAGDVDGEAPGLAAVEPQAADNTSVVTIRATTAPGPRNPVMRCVNMAVLLLRDPSCPARRRTARAGRHGMTGQHGPRSGMGTL